MIIPLLFATAIETEFSLTEVRESAQKSLSDFVHRSDEQRLQGTLEIVRKWQSDIGVDYLTTHFPYASLIIPELLSDREINVHTEIHVLITTREQRSLSALPEAVEIQRGNVHVVITRVARRVLQPRALVTVVTAKKSDVTQYELQHRERSKEICWIPTKVTKKGTE